MAHRLLAPAESVKARAHETRQRLEAQRSTNRVVDALFRAVQLENQAGGGLLAGAIAFRFFLFIVPCVFVLVMGLGVGADLTDANVHDVARQAGIAGLAATAIQSSATASTAAQWATLSVAAFALVVGARNLLKALWLAHALIWRVPLQSLRHPTRGAFGFIAVVFVALLVFRGINVLRGFTIVGWCVAVALYALVPAAAWLVVSSRLFPRRPGVTWRDVWPGAALFGVGIVSLHLLTILWVARSMEAKSQTYGAIGAALTILLWAYLLGRVVTASASLNAALARPPGK